MGGRRGPEALVQRRTTLELILRRYAAKLPGVTFIPEAGVRGFLARRENGRIVIEGLKVERDGETQEMRADVVVDATGRNTTFPEWLRGEGMTVREESSPCGILYYTRHYKLRDGQDEPPRDPKAAAGGADLGYIKFGVFVADNRHFSVTLAVPEIESQLRTAVMKPEIFDAACLAMRARRGGSIRSRRAGEPGVLDGRTAQCVAALFQGRRAQVLNFFALGDAAIAPIRFTAAAVPPAWSRRICCAPALDASPDPVERRRNTSATLPRRSGPISIPWCSSISTRSGGPSTSAIPVTGPAIAPGWPRASRKTA